MNHILAPDVVLEILHGRMPMPPGQAFVPAALAVSLYEAVGGQQMLTQVKLVPTRRRSFARTAQGLTTEQALLADAADRVPGACILTRNRAFDPRCRLPEVRVPAEAPANAVLCDLAAQQSALLEEIDERLDAVLCHGQYIMGPEIAELEATLARMTGRSHAISVGSGTHALEIVLRALGIEPGDEVIVPAFTWISTAEVVRLVGADPVFADIEDVTYGLAAADVARRITPRTRAVIPVGLYGQLPDWEALTAAAPGVHFIEDAAQSFGATRNGRPSGAWGIASCLSFFPSKTLGCYGDGGAILVDDPDLAQRCRAIRTHGGERRHHHTLVGTNGRLDTLQAAILLAKLPSFPAEIAARQRLAEAYHRALGTIPGLQLPDTAPGNASAWAQYTIRLTTSTSRETAMEDLQKDGISSSIYYPTTLPSQPVFGSQRGLWPVAEQCAETVLSLPMHPYPSSGLTELVAGSLAKHGRHVVHQDHP